MRLAPCRKNLTSTRIHSLRGGCLVKTGTQNTFSKLSETLRQSLMDILYTVKIFTGAMCHWMEVNPELTGTLMKVVAVMASWWAFGDGSSNTNQQSVALIGAHRQCCNVGLLHRVVQWV